MPNLIYWLFKNRKSDPKNLNGMELVTYSCHPSCAIEKFLETFNYPQKNDMNFLHFFPKEKNEFTSNTKQIAVNLRAELSQINGDNYDENNEHALEKIEHCIEQLKQTRIKFASITKIKKSESTPDNNGFYEVTKEWDIIPYPVGRFENSLKEGLLEFKMCVTPEQKEKVVKLIAEAYLSMKQTYQETHPEIMEPALKHFLTEPF